MNSQQRKTLSRLLRPGYIVCIGLHRNNDESRMDWDRNNVIIDSDDLHLQLLPSRICSIGRLRVISKVILSQLVVYKSVGNI